MANCRRNFACSSVPDDAKETYAFNCCEEQFAGRYRSK